VSELIKQGANVHARDENGLQPLHHAAQHNNPDVANTLILAGRGKREKKRE
jgi:ankyrin repeat protein